MIHAIILHVFGLLLLQTAEADITVEVNPAQIDVGLSATLDVNCTFTYDGISNFNMASVISMILSRSDNVNQSYKELATITAFAGHTVNLLVQDGATAEGFLIPGGESYLHLQWKLPTKQQAGSYECSILGIDAVGHNVALTNTTQVTENQPGIVDVVSEVLEIREYVKDLESMYSALNNYTHTLEQKVSFMDAYTKVLEQNVSAMDAYTKVLDQKISSLARERLNRMSDLFEFPPLGYNYHKYYISKDAFYHIEAAMTLCYVYGGYLVEIDDENEYRAIQGYLQNITDFSLLYIAGTDEGHDGQWVLQSTNSPCPYMDWYTSGASTSTVHNCLYLRRAQPWRMDDYYCNLDTPNMSIRYMCEVVIS